MKWIHSLLIAAALSVSAIATAGSERAGARLLDNAGEPVGKVTFRQAAAGVVVRIKAEGLEPGWHGVHFHAVGDCSDHDDFQRSTGHVEASDKPHGFLNPEGHHEGDLPNLHAHADGRAAAEFYTRAVSIRDGKAALLDDDGSAVVIHARADNHVDQPIGGAGERVACGVIEDRG